MIFSSLSRFAGFGNAGNSESGFNVHFTSCGFPPGMSLASNLMGQALSAVRLPAIKNLTSRCRVIGRTGTLAPIRCPLPFVLRLSFCIGLILHINRIVKPPAGQCAPMIYHIAWSSMRVPLLYVKTMTLFSIST